MAFILTSLDDEAEVEIVSQNGTFWVTVGTIPHDIGQKIDSLMISTAKHYREQLVEEIKSETIIEIRDAAGEANRLLCKYGVRSHRGLNKHDGTPIACKLAEDDQKRTILHDDTPKIYQANDQFIEMVGGYLERIRRVGIGRYKIEGDRIIDQLNGKEVPKVIDATVEENTDSAGATEGQPESVPFTTSSAESSEPLTASANENA